MGKVESFPQQVLPESDRKREIREFLDGIVGVVEANSYERQCLWERYHRQYEVDWKTNSFGLGEGVGEIGGMPVFISLTTAVVGGYKLLFVYATSAVVDYRLIDKWLEDNVPSTAYDRGRVNKTDAQNFITVFPKNPIDPRVFDKVRKAG